MIVSVIKSNFVCLLIKRENEGRGGEFNCMLTRPKHSVVYSSPAAPAASACVTGCVCMKEEEK